VYCSPHLKAVVGNPVKYTKNCDYILSTHSVDISITVCRVVCKPVLSLSSPANVFNDSIVVVYVRRLETDKE